MGDVLPLAIGVALSPLPIVAVIVMLFTPRGRTNAPAFLAGWVLGLVVVAAVVFVVPGLETRAGDPTRLSGFLGRENCSYTNATDGGRGRHSQPRG